MNLGEDMARKGVSGKKVSWKEGKKFSARGGGVNVCCWSSQKTPPKILKRKKNSSI